jgi:hypothetical protein
MSTSSDLRVASVGSGASPLGVLSDLEASGVATETSAFSADRYLAFDRAAGLCAPR